MFRTSVAVLRLTSRFQQQCCSQSRNLPRSGRIAAGSLSQFKSHVENDDVNLESENLKNDEERFSPKVEGLNSKVSEQHQKQGKTVVPDILTKETLQQQDVFLTDDIPIEDVEKSRFDRLMAPSSGNLASVGEFQSTSNKPSGNVMALRKSYRSMIRALITSNRKLFDDNPTLLLDGLFGTHFGFNNLEFCDFFKLWWQIFESNFAQYDIESLCRVVEYLGVLNFKTNATLRRSLKMKDFNSILVHIAQNENFLHLHSKSIISLYNGLSSFCLVQQSPITNIEQEKLPIYPPQELLTNTMAWILKHKNDDAQFYDVSLACCSIVQRLALMEFCTKSNNNEFLTSMLPVCKTMFDLNANLTEKMAQSVDLWSIIAAQMKFAEGYTWFLENGVLDDNEELVRSWLESAKNFLHIRTNDALLDKVLNDRAEDDPAAKNISLDSFSTRKIPSLMIELCTSTLELAFKTNRYTDFLNLKSLWSQVLRKDIGKSTRRSVNRLVAALRMVESNLDFRKIMETQTDEKDLVSADIWKTTISRLDEYPTEQQKYDSDSSPKTISGFESKFRTGVANRFGAAGGHGGSRVLKEISKNFNRRIEPPTTRSSENVDVPSEIEWSERGSGKSFVPPDIDEFLESQQADSRKTPSVKTERDLRSRITDMRQREQAISSKRDKTNENRRYTSDVREDEGDFAPTRRRTFNENPRFGGGGGRSRAYADVDNDDDEFGERRRQQRRWSPRRPRYDDDYDNYDRGGRSGRVELKKRGGGGVSNPRDERWRFELDNEFDDRAPPMRQQQFRSHSADYDRHGVHDEGRRSRRMPSSNDNDDDYDNEDDSEQFPRGNRGGRRFMSQRSSRNFNKDNDF